METSEDFKKDEAYSTEHEANKEEAREQCIAEVGNITLQVEHFIDQETNEVEQRNITELHNAVQKIANLRFYEFSASVEGKYSVYEETFEYNFTEVIMDFLSDALGYDYHELFTIGEK